MPTNNRQLPLFPNVYSFATGKDVDDDLWSPAGGQSFSDWLGLPAEFRISQKEALQLTAAMICLDVLSQDISKATLRLKERVRGGKGESIVNPERHRIARMLALDPNPRHTWAEWVQMLVLHLGLESNSYAYVKRSNSGEPISLVPLVPGRAVARVNDRTGEVFYDLSAVTVQEAALLGSYTRLGVPERDVLHIRQRMLDGFFGHSTLAAGGRTLSLARDIEQYERNLFGEGGKIRGFFQRPIEAGGPLPDDVFRRVQGQLKKLMQRVRDDGQPALLEDGISWQALAMKADEAEMTKALDKQVEAVCKLWRMPPHKVMHLTAVKYENLTAMEMVYVRDTLVPLCILIEQRMNRTLLTEEERLHFRFEFDRDEMKIADEKIENERVQKDVAVGIISHNEARVDRGYNPRPNGDVYTVMANTKWVDEAGETVVTGAKDASQNNQNQDQQDPPEDDTGKSKDVAPLRLAVSND
jgi:HK97 family phage portal protein